VPTRVRKGKRRIIPLAAIAAAAALGAIAFTSDRPRARSAPQATQLPPHQTRGVQGATAFIDPATGQLREPTADELAELVNSQLGTGASTPTQAEPIVAPSGITGLKLGDDQMTYTVATRAPDGTVSIEHATGPKEAEQKVRRGAVSGGIVAGKEQLRDR
jgi:hypothetical protein